MSVTTEADKKLDLANWHVKEALKLVGEVVTQNVSGADEFDAETKTRQRNELIVLVDLSGSMGERRFIVDYEARVQGGDGW